MGKVIQNAIPMPFINRALINPKWVTLSNESLSLMQLFDEDIEMLKGEDSSNLSKKIFIPGEIYSLGKESVEGVNFGKLYFRLYDIIKEYKGTKLNSLILKEVSIDEDGNVTEGVNATGRRIFSMSPSMCKMMGVTYSPGFELWPINSGFEKAKIKRKFEKKEINYGNMSTYPTSDIDGTIRNIILELSGFANFNNSHIITPTGALIPTYDFVSSLTVFVKQNISTDNGCAGFKINEHLPFRIVGRQKNAKLFSICSDRHKIYVEVDLTKKSLNSMTKDGLVGVAHTALDGKDVDDVIGVKWDESTDENKPNKEMTFAEIDKIFESLDKHFARFNRITSNFYDITHI